MGLFPGKTVIVTCGGKAKAIGRVCDLLGTPDFKYMSGEALALEGGMVQGPDLSYVKLFQEE